MRRIFTLVAAGVLCFSVAEAQEEKAAKKPDKNLTITDPTNAGPDYAVQGEYSGFFADEEEGRRRVGIQVIALGDGKFEAVSYPGGLPSDGWTGKDETKSKGQRVDDVVRFTDEEGVGVIKNGAFFVLTPDGEKELGKLEKVDRKSPTLGAKPPKGAIVLFDETSAETTVENFAGGKLSDDGFLLAGCESMRKFGDHSFHVEFRTPFKPFARGQARGNSGVYLQSRYEVQVLDSFGLEGKNNECGGVYSIAEPAVNMCYPPLSWQTYDVDFTAARYDDSGKKTANARATIRHNGVVIHDDLELPHGTPGKLDEGPGPAPLYLQGHGNPVVFKNIWVVEK